MAENAAASSNISSADNQPAAVIDTPATTVTSTSVSTLPQRLKLTEQVQVTYSHNVIFVLLIEKLESQCTDHYRGKFSL